MDGNPYGTTAGDDMSDFGTVFRLSLDGSSFAVLHTFSGPDGSGPAGVLEGLDGTLYGTAIGGGVLSSGTI